MLENLKKYSVVLASASPRRRELLATMGVDFRVEVIKGIDERYPSTLPALEVPVFLSQLKAKAHPFVANELLIAADTVVVLGNEILGKPANPAEAREMLRALSGEVHTVVTGVTVKTAERLESFSCATQVEFDHISDEEINHYIAKYKPFDKAGSYGIQEWIGYIGIKGINGCFYNVMGLPVQRLYSVLKTF